MKVLIYTHAFAPQVGGVETIVMALARGLAEGTSRENVRVTVVTQTPRGDFSDESALFAIVRRPSTAELVRLLRDADIVHLAGPSLLPLFLGWLMGKRIVVEHHGFQTACPNGQLFYEPDQTPCPGHFMAGRHLECLRCNARFGSLASLKMWLSTFPRRGLCEGISANVTPTEWLSTVLRLPRTTTILHGLRPMTKDRSAEELASPPTFVFLGRLVGTKGARVLLAAAQRLQEQGLAFRIKMIGEGPDRDVLQRKATQAGLNEQVEFLGYLSDERIEKTLAGAVAVVMPSLAGEVFGLVAAENMLHGRLVIASDIGALREVLGETGLFFPPGDDMGLARCMQTVLEDVPRAAALGQQAGERAARLFDESVMAQLHLSLYGRIASCEE